MIVAEIPTATARFADAFGKMVRRTLRTRCGSLSLIPKETRSALERYCPHRAWPKQAAFLSLECQEAFFGGSAGGGKSDTLLMAALQYVDVPGYSALILRRDFQRLSLPGAIMDRARGWLHNTDAKWSDKTVSFPSGAKLQFGYLDNPQDRFRYASSEFQFIGWDELTEFSLADDESNPYLFMFSRLRKTNDLDVPLRVRSASNPGNLGHAWVKKRFIPPGWNGVRPDDPVILDVDEQRKFVPSAIVDNPAISERQYRESLAHLPPVTRARLMAGDWTVAESLQIPEEWLKRYTTRGQVLVPAATPAHVVDERQCERFATIDTAGTSKDKAKESKGKPPSWSVVMVWDYWRAADVVFLRHVWRDRVGWNELKLRVPQVLEAWGCQRALIENAHVGQPLAEELGGGAELVGPVLPGMSDGTEGAKLDRAIAAGLLTRLEQGKMLLPEEADWLPTYILELTSWTGNPDETCDQIDGSSYAAWHTRQSDFQWGGPPVASKLQRQRTL